MIADFDDFCLWMYVIVDTFYQQLAPLVRRPGPAPRCSDSELLTMILVGECRGWAVETERLASWQAHRDLFPRLPSQSHSSRRRRQLLWLLNLSRRSVLNDGGLSMSDDTPDATRATSPVGSGPLPDLKRLDRLVGRWAMSGDVHGIVTYAWMEDGYVLLQHVEFTQQDGQVTRGMEVIGHLQPYGQAPSADIHSRFYAGGAIRSTMCTNWTATR